MRDFGENYVQEAREKIEATGPGPAWHMIGHVQANKAKYIPRLFDYVHTIDRWELLEALDGYGKALSVLFEVNLSGGAPETRHHEGRSAIHARPGRDAPFGAARRA